MNRRAFLTSAIALGAVAHGNRARAAAKPVTIGWLTAQRAPSLAPFLEAFRNGLRELGYREGETLQIDYRYGDDNLLRVAPLAGELVRKPVDLLVVQGAAVALVHELKLPVPAAYVFSGDPVIAGLADSLARPRGNMSGLTFMAAELNAKRLEMLRDIIPVCGALRSSPIPSIPAARSSAAIRRRPPGSSVSNWTSMRPRRRASCRPPLPR